MKQSTTIIHLLMGTACLVAGMSLTSCSTDNDIDLNDLDSTVGIGADNFRLPTSSTNFIKLEDLLDLKEDDVIKILPNGDYQFQKSDDIDPAHPKVEQVQVEVNAGNLKGYAIDMTVPVPAIAPGQTTIPPQTITTFNFKNESDDQIVSLNETSMDGTMRMMLGISALQNYIDRITFDIYVPSYITLEDDDQWTLTGDGQKKRTFADISTANDFPVDLKLAKMKGFSPTDPGAAPATGDMPTVLAYYKDNTFNKNYVVLRGTMKMGLTMKKNDIKNGVASVNVGITPSMTASDGTSHIYITHAEGIFDPKIDLNPSTVNIGDDVPDFLNDDKVSINLNNPKIELTVDNNIDVRAIITGTLTATYKDKNNTITKKRMQITAADNVKVLPHTNAAAKTTTTKVVICRKAGSETGVTYVVKNGTSETTDPSDPTIKVVDDISKILNKIPESIEFTFNAQGDRTYTGKFDLYKKENDPSGYGLGYEIVPKYDFISDLNLDAGSTIVYNDTIDDWNKDIVKNEIEMLEGTTISVEGQITNGTPMNIKIDPIAMDINQKPLPNVKVDVVCGTTGNTVPSNFGNSTYKPLTFKIYCAKGHEEDFKKLDGLILECTATVDAAYAGHTLNSGKYLKNDGTDAAGNVGQIVRIKDMAISLNGKISINLDSK